ncbi:hypothetical protein [Haloglomus litoreum]|uniref:hypothetical protein n=1 Tax=Haloglomus litoreum TaxID=3034026 RepID=UPI0023E8006A|nr:hypothetical protein [Haloglomus sp. DT116]
MSRGVALAVLVLLAGCGGLAEAPGAPPATDTLSPVPVPDADRPTRSSTPSPTVAGQPLVPGVTTARVADPFALVDTHLAGITAASYALRRTTTVRYPDGSLRSREVTTARVGPGSERYRFSNEVTGPSAARIRAPPGRFELWTDGERFLSVFRPTEGPPEYARVAPDRYLTQREYYSPPPNRGELLALLSAFEIRPVETPEEISTPTGTGSRAADSRPATASGGTPTAVRTPPPIPDDERDGPPVGQTLVGYRLTSTSFTGPSALGSVGPGTDVRNASLTMFVDTRGQIRWYTLSYTAVVDDQPARVTRRTRYDLGGVRVERPEWYRSALRATNATATPPGTPTTVSTPTPTESRTVTPTSAETPTAPPGPTGTVVTPG